MYRFLPALLPLVLSCLLTAMPVRAGQLQVTRNQFGLLPSGETVDLYSLTNSGGMSVRVITYGATLIGVDVPDRTGKIANVTLYLDSLENYLAGHPLFGSVVGRFANRIGGASFSIDGTVYQVTPNASPHHIHGGKIGFQKRIWNAAPLQDASSVGVRLSLISADGEEGYPGRLDTQVIYRLNDANELSLDYLAQTDKPTVVNLTNHAYWNLAGAGSGDVLSHVLHLQSDTYLVSDERKVPTGQLAQVAGTPLDFRTPQTIGSRIEQLPDQNYDHCYVIHHRLPGALAKVARVVEPGSGRTMEVLTTQPGVQLYTAKALSARLQGGGKPYGSYHGFCLETQHYPNSPNHANFPSPVLRPGQLYRQRTVFRFGVDGELEGRGD